MDKGVRYAQGGRGRGRGGRSRFGRGRGQHRPSYSHDAAYFAPMPQAGMHPMYAPMPMVPPMYYPTMPHPHYPAMPMTGVMYPPGHLPMTPISGFSRQQFVEAARKQIEYYFSDENLTNDMFMRSKMDNDGWIPLHVIMSFNRYHPSFQPSCRSRPQATNIDGRSESDL